MRNGNCFASLFISILLFTACGRSSPLSARSSVIPDTASKELQTVESLQDVVVGLNNSLALLQNKSDTGAKHSPVVSIANPEQIESDGEVITEQMDDFSEKTPLELPDLAAEPAELNLVSEPVDTVFEIPEEDAVSETSTGRNRKEKLLNIDVYDGYGSTSHLLVSGRLFSDRALDAVEEKDSRFKNLVKTSRRFVLNEAEKVWVRVELADRVREVQTNDEGAFEAVFSDLQDLTLGLHAAKVTLSTRNLKTYRANLSTGKFIIHSPDSQRLGVISDIDDTVLQTHATSKVQMLKTIFLSNYKTQLPVLGMSDLFRAIHHGPEGDGYDATHYVSSSPDNLYSRINLFLTYRNFPEGSIDLKNIGLGKGSDSIFDHQNYKLGRIRKILETYPQRRYILFGDSGERDPEIYRQIAKEFASQIVATYIHNVTEEDPFGARFQGQMLFSEPDKVKKDLLNRGLILPY
jgi:phosphatidate phosphatase APP1